ncbi:hypothetical protein BDV95DRAFT_570044 [Massariosphaeria phaeospora]|uniref:MutL C-terminal dimerisation domain-containing protein n=1 Tax=Massariosphaeria phaeospora TaxID=100035 RepID=A0A7C8I7E8_9PLEO|nr:hypothetical protein BDV95DRAFT_570044 [Massariosphaeria phaeospora]
MHRAGTTNSRGGSILPLPHHVVAQIKSSTAIVSLTGVVLGLLENALDASATKIDATVDLARGGCSVEDNGLGIAPLEFRDDGGLGKLYCTSKYHSRDACLGRNGTFLASLAAMSLVSIVSHHHEHRSHNSVTFHLSKAIDRQLPAPPQQYIHHEKHGTRVTVRNLFGNLPVRVKQRAATGRKVEQDRLWNILKVELAGLMLSWRGVIRLIVRDAENKAMFAVSGSSSDASTRRKGSDHFKNYSAELGSLLNILTQTEYISIDEWPSWIPVSASTPTISIKGAISLDPAPSKRVQFISIGIRPISAESGHNELYNEVNRIFDHSSFGTIEDEADVEENEKVRRDKDKRYKSDGYTDRQLRVRKDVDRYPMFHLRVSLKNEQRVRGAEDDIFNDEANLQAVVDVLKAMVTQWLSAHHFRPRKARARKPRPTASATLNNEPPEMHSMPQASPTKAAHANIEGHSSTLKSTSENRKRKVSTTASTKAPGRGSQLPFAEWSRIKSGKAEFFDTIWTCGKEAKDDGYESRPVAEAYNNNSQPKHLAKVGDTAMLLGTSYSTIASESLPSAALTNADSYLDDHKYDETVAWIDPASKQTFLLNARTGCVLPQHPTQLQGGLSLSTRGNTLKEFNKPVRLNEKPITATEAKTPWLDGLLQNWDNPIFKPVEKQVHRVTHEEDQVQGDYRRWSRFGHSHNHIEKAFVESSLFDSNKLSRTSLQDAQVIAQLDKKFILVKMCASIQEHNGKPGRDCLVLIDQHAADERIRVELLLSELCSPLSADHNYSKYRSHLGHRSQVAFTVLEKPIQFAISSHEQGHFTTHAPRFAAWGILYDISTSRTPGSVPSVSARTRSTLVVSTLPPSISERCKADPQILISFLRSTVWKYAEDPSLPPLKNVQSHLSSQSEAASWYRRLSTCPQGLVDMINSRACRSAIMFNDELTMQQCEELVSKLSSCVFPFMCAHGRPSMVPLVDLGASGGDIGAGSGLGFGSDVVEQSETKSFVDAWKGWKKT